MRRISALLLCFCFLLTACSGKTAQNTVTPAANIKLPMDFSVVEQHDVEFSFAKQEDTYITMVYSPVEDAVLQLDIGMRLFDDFDSDESAALSDEQISGYTVYYLEGGDTVATVTVRTAPANPYEYYGVTTEEEVARAMQSSFFTSENYYSGLRSNITEDFGYELTADWTGTAYDIPAFYLEYIDTDKNTRSMRMYLCDDQLNELFYAIELKADVPADNKALLEKMRAMFFSLYPMGIGRAVKDGAVFEIGLS